MEPFQKGISSILAPGREREELYPFTQLTQRAAEPSFPPPLSFETFQRQQAPLRNVADTSLRARGPEVSRSSVSATESLRCHYLGPGR